jgi:colanic acid/amylovoran biosynthesis glycosyltransferase
MCILVGLRFNFITNEYQEMMANSSNEKKLVIVHSLEKWLSPTQNWIYSQIQFLPSEVENHIVVCREPENLDQFPMPNIHCLSKKTGWRFLQQCFDKLKISKKTFSHIIPSIRQERPKSTYPIPVKSAEDKLNTPPRPDRVYSGLARLMDEMLRRLSYYPCSRFLAQTAQRIGAQVLHSHFGYVGWANMKAAQQTGMKHIATFYGQDVSRFPTANPSWYGHYEALFKQVDCVLCEGPFMAQSLMNLGCSPEKIRVHHLGIRVAEIAFKPRTWTPSNPLRVLIAASFREKKGIPYALEALGILKDEIPLEITIIGDATSEAASQTEKQRILATIKEYRLGSQTRMLGFQPHDILLDEAYKHHLFLSPSVTASDGDTEGGAPIVITEMVASGMPLVSTEHCDIPGVIQPGLRHLLAPERDVDGLIRAIRWLIENCDQWPRILGEGRECVEKEFNACLQGKRLGEIYRMVLD